MTNAFDPRIVKVGVFIDGKWTYFQDIDIRIQGQKFWSATTAFATIKLSNLTRDQRHWLLTNATPVLQNNKVQVPVTVSVGRVTGGTFLLFQGYCYTSTVTPPPDISITFRTVDGSALSSALNPTSFGPLAKLSTIASFAAQNTNNNGPLRLDFNVTNDLQIANFCTTSNTNDLIQSLADAGNVKVVSDVGNLYVRDVNGFNKNRGFILNAQNGMVGIPQATQDGCTAQMLISADVQIGDQMGIKSIVNPSVDGTYTVFGISFDIANRDTPFFYNLTLTNTTAPQPIS